MEICDYELTQSHEDAHLAQEAKNKADLDIQYLKSQRAYSASELLAQREELDTTRKKLSKVMGWSHYLSQQVVELRRRVSLSASNLAATKGDLKVQE